MEQLLRLADFVGFAACHQMASHSFVVGGVQFPVCARDTGIHLGMLSTTLALALRGKGGGFPPLRVAVALTLFSLPMALDVLTALVGWRSSTNATRAVTGFLLGSALPFFLVPGLKTLYFKADEGVRLVGGFRGALVTLLAPAAVFGALYLTMGRAPRAWAVGLGAAVVVNYAVVWAAGLGVLYRWARGGDPPLRLALLSPLPVAVQLTLFNRLHWFFLRAAGFPS